MKEFFIYPAIDLRRGKVVRLKQGNMALKTEYSNYPADIAKEWIRQGANWIHVVNLDGAFGASTQENEDAIQSILKTIRKETRIQIGGGIRTIDQIEISLELGVDRVVLGTAAIEDPDFGVTAIQQFGGEKIAFSFDAYNNELMSSGWQSSSGINMYDLAHHLSRAGAKTIIYTNIKKDGMQTGVDWEKAKRLADQTGIKVIASGGVSDLDDILAVSRAGLAGVIVGRALYEGNFTLEEAINVC